MALAGRVFLILVARARATVWKMRRSTGGVIMSLEKKTEYVNHYSFHIMDPAWGHLVVKMSGHPPFGAQVILNGHEYVACAAHAAGIGFVKEGNCFTEITDPAGLAQIAETLSQDAAIGRLGQACDRWIYSAYLCFGLDLDLAEQQASGFRYCMARRFCTLLDCVDTGFLPDGMLDELALPSQIGAVRTGGIDLNKPRSRAVLAAALALAIAPGGFTVAGFAAKVREMTGQNDYTIRNAAYDLRKLRGKHLADKPGRTRRYLISPGAARIISALLTLREHVIAPLLSGVADPRIRRTPRHPTDIDRHYQALRLEMMALFADLGIACG